MVNSLIEKLDKFQLKQLKEFRKYEKKSYEEASIYTILLDLVDGNGIEEVFSVLHNLASDLGILDTLKSEMEKSKKWKWNRKA